MPSNARASPHDSSSWASGMCQRQRAEVSSSYSPRWIARGTLRTASREVQVGRRRVRRVAPQDDQQLGGAGFHLLDELAERGHLVARLGDDRLGIDHGLADVAEGVVDRVDQGMNGRGLLVADDDQARPAVRLQVASHGVDPSGMGGRRVGRALPAPETPSSRARALREGPDRPRAEGEPMVGGRAGGREHALDRIEPVHRPGREPSAVGELPGVPQARRPAREEVGVEGEDDVGLVEVVLDLDVLAEGQQGAGPGVVAIGRLVLVPPGLGERRRGGPDLAGQGGRADRLGQDAQARPLACPLLVQGDREVGQEVVQVLICPSRSTTCERSGS